MSVDFGVEDVIMKEKANQINEILENLHAGEDCDQEIPSDPVVCLFLVAECEDSADVMFFAIVDEVLDEAGYVAGAFVGVGRRLGPSRLGGGGLCRVGGPWQGIRFCIGSKGW